MYWLLSTVAVYGVVTRGARMRELFQKKLSVKRRLLLYIGIWVFFSLYVYIRGYYYDDPLYFVGSGQEGKLDRWNFSLFVIASFFSSLIALKLRSSGEKKSFWMIWVVFGLAYLAVAAEEVSEFFVSRSLHANIKHVSVTLFLVSFAFVAVVSLFFIYWRHKKFSEAKFSHVLLLTGLIILVFSLTINEIIGGAYFLASESLEVIAACAIIFSLIEDYVKLSVENKISENAFLSRINILVLMAIVFLFTFTLVEILDYVEIVSARK